MMPFKSGLSTRFSVHAWRSRVSSSAVAALAAAALLTSCGGGGESPTGPTPSTPVVASVAIAALPPGNQLFVGATATLSAVGRDAAGQVVSGRTVTWSSTTPAVATVSASGVVTALTVGSTGIGATIDGISASTTLSVALVPVASVAVTPASASLLVGQTSQLAAATRDSVGGTLSGRAVAWSSSNTAVATVSSAGLVTAVGAGTATITAISEGRSGTAAITVAVVPVASVAVTPSSSSLLVGQASQLTATTRDSTGGTLMGRTVTWSSSNTAVATVASAGLVTAVGAGTAIITASSEGRSGTAAITVALVPVASVAVTPASASLLIGQTSQLAAATRDSIGGTLSGRAVAWSSSNTAVATVSSAGVVTAIGAGTATITATSEGRSGTAAITVALVPVASVVVTPNSASLLLGQTSQLAAATRDSAGGTLTGRTITWSTSDAGVATVTSGGQVTAVGAGTATITATSEGQSGTAAITVALVPVASVDVTPASASLLIGQTNQLAATTRDSAGGTLSGRTISWSTSDAGVATVSSAGLVTAVGAGTATITAISEGRSGTAAITVAVVPVASVAVTPASVSLLIGQTSQLSATTRDSAGGGLAGRTISWSTSDSTVATVSSTGLVTAVSAGIATITATSEGRSGTATITASVPLVRIQSGDAQQATVGTALPVRPSVFVGDSSGRPLVGASVRFEVQSGGGSVTGATAVTDTAGVALLGGWTLGTRAGSNTLTATCACRPQAPVVISAIGTAGAPQTMVANSPVSQSGVAGEAVAVPPSVIVRDAYQNPVPGIGVRFATYGSAGSAYVEGFDPTTDSAGVASTTKWVLNRQAGANTVQAGLAGIDPVYFQATGATGPAVVIYSVSGDAQVATAGTAVTSPLQVQVEDQYGNPVAGASVTFVVRSGGGTIDTVTTTTATNGRASGAAWTLGKLAGANTAAAVLPNGAEASFTATGKYVFTNVATGAYATCALSAGYAYCWGRGTQGQLGTNSVSDATYPQLIAAAVKFTAVALGDGFGCALSQDAQVWCWGRNDFGQLGDGTTTQRLIPAVAADGRTFAELAVGYAHACARTAQGAVWCWGNNGQGRLGDGSTTDRPQAVQINGALSFTSISAGGAHTCGMANGAGYCWGSGGAGQLGNVGVTIALVPTAVTIPAGQTGWDRIVAGETHSCGLTTTSVVYCWGDNTYLQIGATGAGSGTAAPYLTLNGFARLWTRSNFSCGIKAADAKLYCWGQNANGQLGRGSTSASASAGPASLGLFTVVTPGLTHACGITTAGVLQCWGDNAYGQLGDKTTTQRLTPTTVKEY